MLRFVKRPSRGGALVGAALLFLTIQQAHGSSLPNSKTSLESQNPTLPKAEYVSPQELRGWLSNGKPVTLIDVREPKEYEAGHIEGAINIPYAQVEERVGELHKETPLVFYCISSSWRAPYAANFLKDHGFEKIYILEGGIVAWRAGGQTIRSSQKRQIPEIAPYPKDLRIALRHPRDRAYNQKIILTAEELKRFDGQGGRPAYVAADGIIYDVTQSRLWREGTHDPSHGRATAGHDLTNLIKGESPHGLPELKKFPVVGYLKNVASDN